MGNTVAVVRQGNAKMFKRVVEAWHRRLVVLVRPGNAWAIRNAGGAGNTRATGNIISDFNILPNVGPFCRSREGGGDGSVVPLFKPHSTSRLPTAATRTCVYQSMPPTQMLFKTDVGCGGQGWSVRKRGGTGMCLNPPPTRLGGATTASARPFWNRQTCLPTAFPTTSCYLGNQHCETTPSASWPRRRSKRLGRVGRKGASGASAHRG